MKCATYISATITETETGCTIEFSNGNQIETPTLLKRKRIWNDRARWRIRKVGKEIREMYYLILNYATMEFWSVYEAENGLSEKETVVRILKGIPTKELRNVVVLPTDEVDDIRYSAKGFLRTMGEFAKVKEIDDEM